VKRERVSNRKHDDMFRDSSHCSTSPPSTLWPISLDRQPLQVFTRTQ